MAIEQLTAEDPRKHFASFGGARCTVPLQLGIETIIFVRDNPLRFVPMLTFLLEAGYIMFDE